MNIAASWPIPSQALPEIYPAQIGELMMTSYEEVLGGLQLAAVLQRAGLKSVAEKVPDLPFGTPAKLYQALEDLYGEQTARGICLRTGRVMFRRGLRAFSGILGLSHRGFRLLPPSQKILRGMDLLAWLLNHYSDQRVRVEKRAQEFLLINERCPHCWGLTKATPCCQLPVGALQEGLAWACSGRHYAVEEIACRAKGDPTCTYKVIRKAPD
jgi:predicted hydrocarbon binding protein